MHKKTIDRVLEQSAPLLALAAAIAVTSCGGATPGTRPDDMSAAEHTRASRLHEARAQQHEARYDPSATTTRESHPAVASRAPVEATTTHTFNPTSGEHEDALDEHEEARDHAAAAQTLRQFEAVECRAFPPAEREACPLLSGVTGIEDVEDGVRIEFASNVPVATVLARMQCHFAYARARAYEDMTSCPLYIRGVVARAGPGASIELVATDSDVVRAVRAQTRMDTTIVATRTLDARSATAPRRHARPRM